MASSRPSRRRRRGAAAGRRCAGAPGHRRAFGDLGRVALEDPRGRELAELVARPCSRSTYTGMNFLPLCTASVCPTNSGITVDRRDQVLMTFFSAPRFITSIFSRSGVSMKGPFFRIYSCSILCRL